MPKQVYQPEFTDLTSITRRSDRCVTAVAIFDKYCMHGMNWLRFGQANIATHDRKQTTTLTSYMLNATDFEEDSAYAICLPLIGFHFEYIAYHHVIFGAWVAPDAGPDKDGSFADFHVPRPGYNPMEHEDAEECSICEKPHIIVPEGYYVPPFDAELYEAVRGKRVEIRIGPAKDEAEQ
jgi:hypothetical protein